MTVSQEELVAQLRKAVIGQKTASLPQEVIPDAEIEKLRKDIDAYDRWITPLVIRCLQGEIFELDRPGPGEEIDKRLATLNEAELKNPTTLQLVRYKTRLDHLYELLRQISDQEDTAHVS